MKLETLLFENSQLLDNSELPEELFSDEIEEYSNRANNDQASDSLKRERQGRIYLDRSGEKHKQVFGDFIVGEKDHVKFKPFEEEDWEGSPPVVDVHSHNSQATFSGNDLGAYLETVNFITMQRGETARIAFIVANPWYNSLLISTAQTQVRSWREARRAIDVLDNQFNQVAEATYSDFNFLKANIEAHLLKNGMNLERFKEGVIELQEAYFMNSSHLDILRCRFLSSEVARRFGFGYYLSDKRGSYSLEGKGLIKYPETLFKKGIIDLIAELGAEGIRGSDFFERIDQNMNAAAVRSRMQSLGLLISPPRLTL